MDKQADPVADVSGDVVDAAPEADSADRQPSLVKGEPGQKPTVSAAEPRPEPAAADPAPEPSVFSPRPKPGNGSGSTGSGRRPPFLKSGRKRSDATVPMDLARQAGVRKASGGLAASDDVEPDVTDVSPEQDVASGRTEETTSTLAAVALARELTGAGFATPGFKTQARADAAGPDQAGAAVGGEPEATASASPAGSASPSGSVPPPGKSPGSTVPGSTVPGSAAAGSAVTNPAWTSPAPPAERPGSANWNSPDSGPAAPFGSGYALPAGSGTGSAAGPAAGFAVGSALDAADDQTAAPHRAEPVPAPPAGPAYPPPVPSENQKPKVGSPFTRPGKKKLRPNAGARPGGAIGNGKAAMSVKSKPGPASRPAGQVASKSRPGPAEVRDAQLVLSRVEPWSVMKFSFLVSLVGFVVLFIVVAVMYFAFSSLGVFHSIEQTVGLVTSSKGNPGTNAASWFSAGTVLSYTLIAGAVDVVLITALSTVGAVIYNAVTRLTGGIEITLAEAD